MSKVEVKPDNIIEAFDECLMFIYGSKYARDNPNKYDTETAKRWISQGLTVILAMMVFFKEMSWMHEKFLHWKGHQDRSNIPGCLKVFDENIEVAIRRYKNGGELDDWEKTISLWRARCKSWLKNPNLWRQEMWGLPPNMTGARVPKSITDELMRTV